MAAWADFIAITFDPDGATAAAFVDGNLVADKNAGGVADVDVFWIGALTPDSVLEVNAEGTSERPIGIFNKVRVEFYPHVPGTTSR